MKEIVWLVRAKSAPAVVRHCKKCGAPRAFGPSGAFRVNAQQKSLDVWLIYKCATCEATWNLTILSRVNPRAVAAQTLDGFCRNDASLAMRYSCDTALIKRNGGKPLAPEIEIEGEGVVFPGPVRLRIVPEFAMDIKVSAVLRAGLGLSRKAYDRMCADGTLRGLPGGDGKKHRLSGEVVLEMG